jgi:predicted transcriptional regulator YdeE
MEEPRFERKGAFRVLGVEDDAYKIDEVDPGFYDLWMNRFMARADEVGAFSVDGAHYGVWFGTRGTDISVGTHLAGMAVTVDADPPDGWIMREVPAAEYAVFETTLEDVGDAAEYALDEWLPSADYEYDGDKPRFDLMPPGTTGPASPVFVWIPVLTKLSAGQG